MERARLVFELPDLRALRETPVVSWAGRALTLQPEAGEGRAYARAASSRVRVEPGKSYSFSATLELRGGRALSFLEPAGAVRATMRGDWPSPSFCGYSSPTDRSVSKAGFSAEWYLPESAQVLPRAFDAAATAGGDDRKPLGPAEVEKAAFGVELLDGVDSSTCPGAPCGMACCSSSSRSPCFSSSKSSRGRGCTRCNTRSSGSRIAYSISFCSRYRS